MAEGDKDADDIPLLNVKSSVLKKVVEYMRYHADNPMKVSRGRQQTHGRGCPTNQSTRVAHISSSCLCSVDPFVCA